jgi:hypothetical protein
MFMRSHRTMIGLAIAATLSLSMCPTSALAQQPGDFGAGVYMATHALGRGTAAYPTFGIWATPEFLIQFGVTFSTTDAENYGFMARSTYTLSERGDAKLVLGGVFDVFEVAGRTFVGFAPIGGIHYDATDEFSINLDALPFAIGNIANNTDAAFFQARLGATYWF